MSEKILTEDEKQWIIRAIEKGHTKLEIKKKLQMSNYDNSRILALYDFYDEIIPQYTSEEELPSKEEEEKFSSNVKEYLKGNIKDLSWSERRAIKKFIKSINSYNQVLRTTLKKISEELDGIHKRIDDKKKISEEEELIRRDLIDRLIESKQIVDVDNMITGEEATKENLKDIPLDILIKMMEENVAELQKVTNGKIE